MHTSPALPFITLPTVSLVIKWSLCIFIQNLFLVSLRAHSLSPSLYLNSSTFDNNLFMFIFTVFGRLTWLGFIFDFAYFSSLFFFLLLVKGFLLRVLEKARWKLKLMTTQASVHCACPTDSQQTRCCKETLGWGFLFFFSSPQFSLSHLKSPHAFFKNHKLRFFRL